MYAAVPMVGMNPEQGLSYVNLILGGAAFCTKRYHEYMRAGFDVSSPNRNVYFFNVSSALTRLGLQGPVKIMCLEDLERRLDACRGLAIVGPS